MRLSLFLFLFPFLLTAAGFTQPAPQAAQASYEGQNVSAVSLIANPHRDLEPLRGCVSQQPGEPYSEAKVQASVVALEKEGRFRKVQVSVVPDISGLRVNFLLEPPYYLGAVDFPGAGKSFSYTRLLQAVDLPDEGPYDSSRLPPAERALTTFLHKDGFFRAEVHTDAKIDY